MPGMGGVAVGAEDAAGTVEDGLEEGAGGPGPPVAPDGERSLRLQPHACDINRAAERVLT